MPSPDEQGVITRRLLVLQQIAFFSELAPSVLVSLAERAREVSVSRGQIAPPPSPGAIRFFPDGTLRRGAAGGTMAAVSTTTPRATKKPCGRGLRSLPRGKV